MNPDGRSRSWDAIFVDCPRVPISNSNKVLGKPIYLMPEKFSELKPERAIGRDG